MRTKLSKLDANAAATKRWRSRLKRAMTMIEKLERQRKRLEAKKPVEQLTKPELLDRLETVPQHFWPPRPTRQDKAELVQAIKTAETSERPRGKALISDPNTLLPAIQEAIQDQLPKSDNLDIPPFLKRQQPDPVAEQIKQEQDETKRKKARGRIEKMKAKQRGDLKKMPLSGKAALDFIRKG